MAKRRGMAEALTADLDRPRAEQAGTSATVENLGKGYVKPKIKEKVINSVDPKRCRPWKFADRNKLWFTEENCADLIHGFRTRGQDFPGLGRRITGDPDFDFEIILGNRRRWTAEYTGLTYDLEITTASDAECCLRMDSENDDHKDISDFERAVSYKRMLDSGVFASGRQLAVERNVSKSAMAYLLSAAKMNDTRLMDLFGDLRELPIKPTAKLMAIWERSDEEQGAILAKAAQLKKEGVTTWPTAKIIKTLIEAHKDKPAKPAKKEYSDAEGKKRVSAEVKKGELVLTVNKDGINKRDLKKLINEAIAEFI